VRHDEHVRHLGGWGWVFPGITLLLFWVLLILVILLLWRALAWRSKAMSAQPGPRPGAWGHPTHGDGADGAERVLAERLARGEIDVDEYRRRLDALRGSAPPPPPPPQ